MAGDSSRRVERINEQLRAEISDLIRRELKDPRLAGLVSITSVEVTPDLSTAKVYASVMGSDEDQKASLQTLRRAAGFFRHELMARLTLRRVPELTFLVDPSIERGDHILDLLRGLRQDEPNAPAGDELRGKKPEE